MPNHGLQFEVPPANSIPKNDQDLLNKGFQLAFFMVPNRVIALEILSNAMSKLRVQRSRERKRVYWRDKYLKRRITRIARDEEDALQWLLYVEAENYEKRQEEAGLQTVRDMVVRYIKHLVQMTTAMSAFYVNVGLHRLLFNYSTSEARSVYEWVAQHYPGDPEYRKVKGTLMKRLQARFKDLIRTCTVQYGETRFETSEDQSRWVDLVDQCLSVFTPWSTAQTCRALAGVENRVGGLPYPLSAKGRENLDQDIVEIHRCHVFIEPSCHGRITSKLGLDSLHARLALPRFFGGREDGRWQDSGNPPGKAPELSQEERNRTLDRLELEAETRRRVSAKHLRILADGNERLQLDVENGNTGQFDISAGTNLIEIWNEDQQGRVLLALHYVQYHQWKGIARETATVDLGQGQELLIKVVPADQPKDELGGASITFTCQPVSQPRQWRQTLQSRSFWFGVVPKYGIAALALLTLGWVLGTQKNQRELDRQQASARVLTTQLAQERAAHESLQHALEVERGTSVEAFALTPNDLRIRTADANKEPVVSFSPHTAQVVLELPLGQPQNESCKAVLTAFLSETEILSETFPKPQHETGEAKLKFILPAVFVVDRMHYVITVHSITRSESMSVVRTFSFYIKKQ